MGKEENRFIIGVGAQKAGTTLLYDLLKNHPQLAIGNKKELHYFDYAKTPNIDDYLKLFNGASKIKFEVTPSYMYYRDAIEKISKTNSK